MQVSDVFEAASAKILTKFRVRRVKCDEAKPSCERCRKFGAVCGYPNKANSYKPNPPKRNIAPKASSTLSGLRKVQSGPRIREDEARYFRFFCEEAAAEIAGPYRTSVWARMVPQAGEAEPFIAYAAVALGALTKSIIDGTNQQGSVRPSLTNPHYEFAVKLYCKALKGMREAIEQINPNPRNALLACLLAFCFESLQDNQEAASTHAIGGVTFLYDIHMKKQYLQDMKSKGKALPPSYCASQFAIEEDLHAAFSLLDLQSSHRLPIATRQKLVLEMNQAITLIPQEITNLKVCCTFIQIITRRNHHWIAVARSAIRKDSSLQVHEDGKPNTMSSSSHDVLYESHLGDSKWNASGYDQDNIPVSLSVERQRYLEDTIKWQKSTKKLYEAIGYQSMKWTTTRFEEFIHINMLKLWALISVLLLAGTFYPPETIYDSYLPEFRTVVELSELIYPHLVRDKGPRYHFFVAIIPALFHVGMTCRDRELRGKAIEMLCKTPGYREGIWDAMAVGKIAECAMSLEEEWRDENEYIPGDRRVSLVTVKAASKEKRATAVFRQGMGTADNDTVERIVEICW